MRVRPLTALAAIAAVTLVLAGCDEARLGASPEARTPTKGSSRSTPGAADHQQQLVQLLLDISDVPAAPIAGFGGLQARMQQATEQAAASGATLSVGILDRKTHELISNGNTQIIGTASVAKLFIADDLLLQEAQGKTRLSPDDRQALDVMLKSSDDGAAERFWDQDGGDNIISQVAGRYGLSSTTPPSDGRWWNTMSSLTDLINYYDKLLDGGGGLPAERAKIIVNDLAQSTPNGVDGYPQRFGIPDGLFAEPVAVKQGWMCCIGTEWMHLSTGVVGADRRYIVVVESLQSSDDATARDTITQAVKTMFPGGRIGPTPF
ncbi:hypothetical protein [Mycobacterium montefiorense]|uniref:Lipoprotein LppW n=1 Tax=Mycobacterium montefiorense TaxID=154654 RepID=A0AA37UZ65_9MYCO|nr:hypothetical protein [Mycobacterium montefiorense]MCV7427816.1 hypothetical protein [Mycobacterium montefiorense]GBG40356.1 putative lipoprotein LppW [Mycobacterium montefiorense]GKU36281.1 putative lipoprotein LppW [Mycobacterium montefiorense]GKU42832.1 putative lipoprotein LppW [Mycobacterium montefiorense]GKU46481.1 putative lipoprotein LppW [Mycobacterium montefiorense]